ncbi:metalloprotease family protein [Chitinophaga caseinilytica]|uniref:Metalloprotease family protein n=1 Tax=Chitinophaga caseinilytica TaxID=2267521 RepID=A0ABZ2Z3F6_9BACT
MFIPGIIISALTFPGVIVHELAHQLYCRALKVPVFKVVYFQMENPVGYVLHEKPKSLLHSALICLGPFMINTLLGFLIALPSAIQYNLGAGMNILDYAMVYLGVSIAMHAFPSTGDASALWQAAKEDDRPWFTKVIVLPIIGFIYLGALGSFFWLDLIYGIAIAVGLPWMVLQWAA